MVSVSLLGPFQNLHSAIKMFLPSDSNENVGLSFEIERFASCLAFIVTVQLYENVRP